MGKSAEKLSDSLTGLSIVISGNFSISRDEMKALIVSHGGKNSGSISGKTSYLLAGEKAGPEKLKKAEALGVKVISEADFMNMIASTDVNEINENESGNTLVTREPEPYNGEQLTLF